MNETLKKAAAAMLAIQRYPWEQGTAAQAMYEAGETAVWVNMAHDAVLRQQPDGRLAVINANYAVTDPASNGEVVYRAWELTGDPFYKEGAERMFRFLKEQAPRTEDGVLWHNETSNNPDFSPAQLWIDSMYMAPPFLAVMGDLEDAAQQIRGLSKYLRDPETGLMFHIYDAGTGKFVRKKRWATGNGWTLMGIRRVVEEACKAGREDLVKELQSLGNSLLSALLPYQTEDGRFHDILDEPDSFIDGTSAVMTAAFIYRSVLTGDLSSDYLEAADRAFDAVAGSMDEFGLLHEVCGCPDFLRQGTSCEAQAAFIMAGVWKERLASGRA